MRAKPVSRDKPIIAAITHEARPTVILVEICGVRGAGAAGVGEVGAFIKAQRARHILTRRRLALHQNPLSLRLWGRLGQHPTFIETVVINKFGAGI